MLRLTVQLSAAALLLMVVGSGDATTGSLLDVRKSTVDSGGGVAVGGAYTMTGTIAQHDANERSGGERFAVRGGFWALAQPSDLIFANDFD